MKTLISIIIILSVSVPVCAADCMRCVSRDRRSFAKTVLLCKGDTVHDLMGKCGPPSETIRAGTVSVWRKSGKTGRIKIKVPLVKYRYNCGDGRFVKELLFQAGVLKSIKNLRERGSGPSRCW